VGNDCGQLGLEELEKLSFQAIRAGLSEANILEEVFSRFTSKCVHPFIRMRGAADEPRCRYPPVLEMQVDILCAQHYGAPAVSNAFARMMGPVADGELPHSAAVLASIFAKLAAKGRAQ
jgi:hypothetical protein